MEKELCFKIEGDDIFLDHVLVEYECVPIFFVCRGRQEYYIVLCVDIDRLNYIVEKVSIFDIYDLLNGNVTMRESIVKHPNYWMVESGDSIDKDVVECYDIKTINVGVLPESGAYFQVLTQSIENYKKEIEERAIPGTGRGTINEKAGSSLDYKYKASLPFFGGYGDWGEMSENIVIKEKCTKGNGYNIEKNNSIAA